MDVDRIMDDLVPGPSELDLLTRHPRRGPATKRFARSPMVIERHMCRTCGRLVDLEQHCGSHTMPVTYECSDPGRLCPGCCRLVSKRTTRHCAGTKTLKVRHDHRMRYVEGWREHLEELARKAAEIEPEEEPEDLFAELEPEPEKKEKAEPPPTWWRW